MMLSKRYATRGPVRLAVAAMLVLLVFAWQLYMERVAYSDLAYHLFYYLKDNILFIQNQRFVALVTQLPTLLAVKAGLPLDVVLHLYSLLFVLFYTAVLLACAYWFKNEHVALVVALQYLLLASHTFYWAQSEFPQALAVLLLFYGGVARQTPLPWRFSTLALAALIPVFILGHPLTFLPFLFIWAYDWLLNKRFRDWPYYGMLALAVAVYGVRVYLSAANPYEANRINLVPNLVAYFPHYLSLESFNNFWHLCSRNFLALPVLLALLTGFYTWQRNTFAWLRLGLVWAAVLGYAFLINVAYPDPLDPAYIENMYLPLTLFVAVPFALELLPALEAQWQGRGRVVAMVLVAVVLVVRLGVIWQCRVPYVAYQHWMQRLLTYTHALPERKFIINPDNVDPHHLRAGWPSWALPGETMLRSARYSPDSAQTIRAEQEAVSLLLELDARPATMFGPSEYYNQAELPRNYYRFPLTRYRLLNTAPPADASALQAYIAARPQIRLELPERPQPLRANKQHAIEVKISVPDQLQPLHSGLLTPHPTLVRAAFYSGPNWPIAATFVESPLEVDVWQPWTQTIALRTPAEPGTYMFEVRLISKDFQEWPVRVQIPVEVVK
ncbi:hypothetical protein [Hymenobacter sp. BT190]|uniref:hypothetical protein n=1 Tax=Hymenobacter sp. BT190 TaxID=2763505 RepID=UPI0016516476|nr:hypothetical protein [Hymenobacter sp. BT190]MBC6700564.1 hypothetical protein [Hymenobacter sp. BT190]